MDRVYTLAEAAKTLRVSEKWLRAACKDAGLPHIRMAEKLLFTDRHLEQILERHEARPKAPVSPKQRSKKKPQPSGEVVSLAPRIPYRLRQQTS